MLTQSYWHPKSDVYSFGRILLKFLTERKSLDKSRPARQQNLHKAAMPLLHRWIDEINFLLYEFPIVSENFAFSFLEAITKDNPHTVAGTTSRCPDSGNNNSSNSDLTFHEDQNNGDKGMDNCDDVSNYDDNDDYLFYENDDDDECDYLSMQAQFDNVDFPVGVEATVSWLNEPASNSKVSSQVSFSSDLASGQTSTPINSEHVSSNFPQVPSSSSTLVSGWSNSHGKKEATEDELQKKYQSFKHFNVVEDFSDHHYTNLGFQGQQQLAHVIFVVPEKICMVSGEIHCKLMLKSYSLSFSDIIYVRVCEAKKDLLRVVIIEPQGTPYHDGLFVFDVLFPQNYPDVSLMVYYYYSGLRLNSNLYNYGKVCLELLNTWSGKGNEKWLPKTSTMLQVLVSIQALILNANPFFDEPGYETSYAGCEGERRSHACHEDAFVLSLKTMTRRPPKVMIVYPGSNFYFIQIFCQK
ncbi:putative ubiquitin-conjugating enzyme E2 25 [Capsicum baccatum]|uniref:Ubiquitin-conjugating enzyme E2 25 n=1 Tax=Capsicum baccatum TaxID=33114 RepID=A0A2G2VSA8_CAPBA|nr:putative ubiquitin-conjugating enzyme E2 25 [Capsicum baccatum]